MAKKTKPAKLPTIKKTSKEQLLKTDLSFDELLELAVNTSIKKKKGKN